MAAVLLGTFTWKISHLMPVFSTPRRWSFHTIFVLVDMLTIITFIDRRLWGRSQLDTYPGKAFKDERTIFWKRYT